MRNILYIPGLFLLISLLVYGCNDLDLNPLSQGSSENWYSNQVEINMSINDLYRSAFWGLDDPAWTDDWMYRETLTPVTSATINGQWGTITTLWSNSYKAISRANTLITNLTSRDSDLPENIIDRYVAEARFVRASVYSRLIAHFGDVIYYTNTIDIEEAYTLTRTDKTEILQAIYEDYDFAIEHLPEAYGGAELARATKGAAMALKARIALYNEDWNVARDASRACIELNAYELHSDYGDLFLPSSGNSKEIIFSIPRSSQLNSDVSIRDYIPRNLGGWGAFNPSWDLFCSYLCTDGLPIDESPLFDPQQPFQNRDPRCNYTIVPFGTPHLGFIYEPHPDSIMVLNLNTGQYQINNDTRSNQQFAAFNGLVWKKGIDESWADDFRADNDIILVRYADVLLMHAEARIELGEIDEDLLDIMNLVRARAYQVSPEMTEAYPAVSTIDQEELRRILRIERRMEFAREGLRYMDLIRWRLAEKALNKPNYGMIDVAELREKIIKPGLWFFPETPDIDEDGIADFSKLASANLIRQVSLRKFDASRQYLWPIPTKEVLINENIKQNPGY